MRLLSDVRLRRLAWAALNAFGLAALLAVDWLTRPSGQSFMAPSAGALWLSVGLGVALGAAGAAQERYLLRHRRDFLLAFARAPLRERLSWGLQRTNLWLGGWFLALLLALAVGCYLSGVFVLPVVYAANAVLFAFNGRRAAQFAAEARRQTEEQPQP
jgi:hypothetical protein